MLEGVINIFSIGRDNLVNCISELTTKEIKKIQLFGILDKQLICTINTLLSKNETQASIQVVIPNVQNFKMKNWFCNFKMDHNDYQIRTNLKCTTEFIIIDDSYIFISGNSCRCHNLNEKCIFIIGKEDPEGCNKLKDVFSEAWNSGYDLHI